MLGSHLEVAAILVHELGTDAGVRYALRVAANAEDPVEQSTYRAAAREIKNWVLAARAANGEE